MRYLKPCGGILLAIAAITAIVSAAGCNTAVQFRVAAFDDWYGVVSNGPISNGVSNNVFIMSHDSYSDSMLAGDRIKSGSRDRMMNFTLWLPPGVYGVYFKATYRSTKTGLLAAILFNDQLITQTGQPGWNTSTVGTTALADPNYGSYQTLSPAVACTAPPATVNAFGQSYTDFISRGNLSAPQPQWISSNGNCNNATGSMVAFRTVITVPAAATACSNATHPYLNSVQPWSQWREYNIGVQNASKSLQLRFSSQTYSTVYLANYTMQDYGSWYSGVLVAERARVADYKLTVDDSTPVVLGVKSQDQYPYSDGFGIVAALLFDNQVVATTGEMSGWKATNNSALVRAGWNWNATYDTTGWVDVNPYACSPQQDYGFVQPFVSDLGSCAKFVGYPNCNEQPYVQFAAYYYRYVFNPASYVAKPPSVCLDTSISAVCPAGLAPASNVQVCNICPMNTYKYSAGNGSCIACPATMSTNATAASSCSCAPGYGWNGATCGACPANSFKTDFSNATCASCATAAYQSCTNTSFTCAAGYTLAGDGMSCVPCAAGTYKTLAGSGQCSACSANSTTASAASTLSSDCACLPGYGWSGVACSPCSVNTTKSALGTYACTACPADAAFCNATSFTCAAGYTLSANGTQCTQCPAGTYKLAAGNQGCSTCPPNAQCIGSSIACAPGATLSPDGTTCELCASASYKSTAGNGTCSLCPFGTATTAAGSISAADCLCVAGMAGNGTGGCSPCAVGTYKPLAGNGNCTACQAGYTTLAGGAIMSTDCECQPGFEWDGFVCLPCGTNKVKTDAGNAACQPCPANAVCTATTVSCVAGYTPASSGSLCVQCSSGTFKDTVGNQACTACPAGSSNAQCSYMPTTAGNTSDSGASLQNQESAAATTAGLQLSMMNVGIFAGIVTVIFILLGLIAIKLCQRRNKRGGDSKNHHRASVTAESVTESMKRPSVSASDFSSSSLLQTNVYASRTYTTSANATTMMVNDTEFAMPGYLQYQAGRDFRWESPIAKGGGGEVFIGHGFCAALRTEQDDGVLVVKIVAPTRSAISLKAAQAFDQEIAVMHYLGRHRNISQMLGWCEEPLAILMKHYKLGDLLKFVKAGYLTTKAQMYMFTADICSALNYMHGKGVAHRDIKPQNVFIDIDSDGGAVCVLGDFGIANIFSKNAHLVEGFNVVNVNGLTIAYSAPEVVRRFRARDNSAEMNDLLQGDMFSISMIIYLLLVKREAWSLR